MNRYLLGCILTFSLLVISPIDAAERDNFEFDAELFDAEMRRGIDLWSVPGTAVTVVTPDDILFSKSYGTTSINGETPVTSQTLVAAASTSKAMAAVAAMLLVDRGLLSLDDKVSDYLPRLQLSVPYATVELTVRDMLAQTVGIGSNEMDLSLYFHDDDVIYKKLANIEFANSFRSQFTYSNTLYYFLGKVITEAAGEDWKTFIHNELWSPIGMDSTYVSKSHAPQDTVALTPHYWNGHEVLENSIFKPLHNLPTNTSGSFWTTLNDMQLWLQFLLNKGRTASGEQLLKPEILSMVFEPQMLIRESLYPVSNFVDSNWHSYGFGWFQQDIDGYKVDYHTGSVYGLTAMLGIDQARGIGYAIYSNRDHAEMRHAMLWHLMDAGDGTVNRDWNNDTRELFREREKSTIAHSKKVHEARVSGTEPSLRLEDYAGVFQSEDGSFILTVETNGEGELKVTDGLLELYFEHWHNDAFATDDIEYLEPIVWIIDFMLDDLNNVKAIDIGHQILHKVEPKD